MNKLHTFLFTAILVPASAFVRAQQAGGSEGLPPLREYIKPHAKRYAGMCNVYVQDGRYLMEVPDSLEGRDILSAITIIQGSAQKERSADKRYGYSGDAVYESVFRFQRAPGNRMTMVQPMFLHTQDTSAPSYRAAVSSLLPVVLSFEVKAKDEHAALIDFTEAFKGDIDLFSLRGAKDELGIGELQPEKSFIKSVTCFPGNINFRSVKSYGPGASPPGAGGGSTPGPDRAPKKPGDATIWEVGASWILLPETPMQKRFFDERVGYFTKSVRDLDNYPNNPHQVQLATRWNLQPKPGDMQRYLRGELVEPAKPIIFYIDRDTPEYLVPYFIDGVNEWRRAFEKAGFKNAITARPEPAADDTTYSLEDVRYSYISYKASPIPNAYGPSVCDPRSGEIISSRVAVFHNIMDLIQRWYFAMCATNDPAARQFPLSREVMGRLVKNVITHEIGHALGLRHNFAGSSTYDVDSIRNPAFVKANGFGASVMDYMRFNYVVQPEDKMPADLLLPNIGVYDLFAIEWGYRCLPQLPSPKAQADSLERWVTAKRKDERLLFGKETDLFDPRFQSEDVGSNAAKAGELGMKNLRLAMLHFDKWMTAMKADEVYYKQQYRSMLGRYHNYLNHALRTLGGRYNYEDALPAEGQPAYVPVSRARQEEVMEFLEKYILHYPDWLFPPDIMNKAGFTFARDGAEPFAIALSKFFMAYSRILQNEIVAADKAYKASELFDLLYNNIYGKLAKGQPVNEFDRLLQRTLLASMISNAESKAGFSKDVSVQLLVLIEKVQAGCKTGKPLAKEVLTKAHLQSLSDMINIWKTGTGQSLMAIK